jgi:ArsR family transcriptional regulator
MSDIPVEHRLGHVIPRWTVPVTRLTYIPIQVYSPHGNMTCTRLIEIYNCLCDKTRLRIVHLLGRSPLCVCHLQDILGLTQVAASKHLSYLRHRGLVESRRHARWMIYSLPVKRPRELDWQLRCLQDCLPTHPVFRDDLRKLKALQSDCGWVTEAVGAIPSGTRRPLKIQRTPK